MFFWWFLAKFTPLFTPNSHHYFLRLRKAISPTAIGITFEVLTSICVVPVSLCVRALEISFNVIPACLVNVNSRELLYLQRTPFGVFFLCFLPWSVCLSHLLTISLIWYNEVRTVPHFRRVYGFQGPPTWIVMELVSIAQVGRSLVVHLILIV